MEGTYDISQSTAHKYAMKHIYWHWFKIEPIAMCALVTKKMWCRTQKKFTLTWNFYLKWWHGKSCSTPIPTCA